MSPHLDNLTDLVMQRCDELATCSEDEHRVTRRFLTPPMRDVHERLAGWMNEARLTPRVDCAGNIIGSSGGEARQRVLILGSHLDSVPGAGRYDGVLGVLIAWAVAHRLRDESLPLRVDVVGFSEEEGVRFSMPYLGSAAAAGIFDPLWLERTDREGKTLREVIGEFGLDPEGIVAAAYSPEQVIAYVEPHLEQGPVLEQANLPLGVVTCIAGQSRLRLEFCGIAGHAGTTPMQGRSDALVMASQFVTQVHTLAEQTPGLRATVGQLAVAPNAPNVIPARVELSLDVRHTDDLTRERAINDLLLAGDHFAKAAGGQFKLLEQTCQSTVSMDGQVNQLLSDSVSQAGTQPLELFSGAGHDAVVMAKKFPSAMLFIRHPGGISHHPDERVERDDVATAIEVLTQFVLKLAQRYEANPVTSN